MFFGSPASAVASESTIANFALGNALATWSVAMAIRNPTGMIRLYPCRASDVRFGR